MKGSFVAIGLCFQLQDVNGNLDRGEGASVVVSLIVADLRTGKLIYAVGPVFADGLQSFASPSRR
jgi:hypothetical protein